MKGAIFLDQRRNYYSRNNGQCSNNMSNCGNKYQSNCNCGNTNNCATNNCADKEQSINSCPNIKDKSIDSCPHKHDYPVGMGYVPWQQWGNLYDLETGYKEGTIFKDLNIVFCGVRGRRNG